MASAMRVAATMAGILLLNLSCIAEQAQPSKGNTPVPTPMNTTVERIVRDYESNQILGRDLYEGKFVTVVGVAYGVTETSGGYELILEVGDMDSQYAMLCKTDHPSYVSKGEAVEVYGRIKGRNGNLIVIEDCFEYSSIKVENVQSKTISLNGNRPTRGDIKGACNLLEKADYQIADDNKWSAAEGAKLNRIANSLDIFPSDIVVAILQAIIEVEGPNAKRWCTLR